MSCLHTPPSTNSTSGEAAQKFSRVWPRFPPRQKINWLLLLFSFLNWRCLEWGQLSSLLWETPTASPGKSRRGPGGTRLACGFSKQRDVAEVNCTRPPRYPNRAFRDEKPLQNRIPGVTACPGPAPTLPPPVRAGVRCLGSR